MGEYYMSESTLADIMDIISGAKDTVTAISGGKDTTSNKFKTYYNIGNKKSTADAVFRGSITAQAKKLIAYFPVICPSSISIETANLISKALERKAVMLLQLIFSSTILTQFGDNETSADYLNKFFNNLDFSTISIDDLSRFMENADISPLIKNNAVLLAEMSKTVISSKHSYYEETISESSLQDFRVTKYDYEGYNVYNEAAPEGTQKTPFTKSPSFKIDPKTVVNVGIKDSDVKKSNELAPSMLIINYMASVNGSDPIPTESIIGVKTRLVVTDSNEIIKKIYTKNKDSHGLLNLFRATTGEIHFVRDFLLAIDKAKVDAISRSRKGSENPIWKVLEKRSLKQKTNKAMMRSNDAAPITSLVITEEDVDYLKKQHNIHIDKTSVAKSVLDAYNLLCLVIVDETVESAKFLYDSEEWETVSFRMLEKESNDSAYKKVINLMNKVR